VALTGVENDGVALIPPVPTGLPEFEAPEMSLVESLIPAALGIALMGFTESISAARAFRESADPPVNGDRELIALGAANVGGGLFQAYGSGGGLSQTAVNDRAGARTQLAAVSTAGVVALTLLVLAPVLDNLPEATLGAVVVMAGLGLASLEGMRRIRSVRLRDWLLACVAVIGVLWLGVLDGILVAVAASLTALIWQVAVSPWSLSAGRQGRTSSATTACIQPIRRMRAC
jgi:SulP family sulfate permease